MPARRRKKNIRTRGTRTCGWGLCHRGKGNKGGVGRAGGGKKADCKKLSFDPASFGKHGFTTKNTRITNAISIKEIEEKIPNWQENKIAEQKEGVYVIDLKKAGYNKVLSQGIPTKKLKIIAEKASAKTIEKFKKSGCELVTV